MRYVVLQQIKLIYQLSYLYYDSDILSYILIVLAKNIKARCKIMCLFY